MHHTWILRTIKPGPSIYKLCKAWKRLYSPGRTFSYSFNLLRLIFILDWEQSKQNSVYKPRKAWERLYSPRRTFSYSLNLLRLIFVLNSAQSKQNSVYKPRKAWERLYSPGRTSSYSFNLLRLILVLDWEQSKQSLRCIGNLQRAGKPSSFSVFLSHSPHPLRFIFF